MRITEQWILTLAPGPAVAETGRGFSQREAYAARGCSRDGKTFWAVCSGSAQNPYYVSADWSLHEREPLFSCSCASRHFPCKHVLGLLYELLAEREFTPGEAPDFVLRCRAKHAAERKRAAERLERARRVDAVGRAKKLEHQLQALEKANALAEELSAGGSGVELPAHSLDRLSGELGNLGMPAPEEAAARLAMRERRLRQDGSLRARSLFLRDLARLSAISTQSAAFLRNQLSGGSYAMEDPVRYAALGGVWRNDELRELGSYSKNARLIQLSFDVSFDEVRRVYTEQSWYLELNRAAPVRHLERRPVRERFTAAGDSCFDLLEVPLLYETPMALYPDVWWENAAPYPLTEAERAEALACGGTIAAAAEDARAQLSDPFQEDTVPALLRVSALGHADGRLVMEDEAGGRIILCSRKEAPFTALRLASLPFSPAGSVLFGLMYYDSALRRLCLHPYSLVTAEEIIRLQY